MPRINRASIPKAALSALGDMKETTPASDGAIARPERSQTPGEQIIELFEGMKAPQQHLLVNHLRRILEI